MSAVRLETAFWIIGTISERSFDEGNDAITCEEMI